MEKTVDDVYEEFKNRRAGMVKALTTDVEIFYRECDPAKENLCLYGFEDKTWKVGLPAEEVPPELPEPSLGINFARDGMTKKDWLSLVAVHSDAWLTGVAIYQGACLSKQHREQLFSLMNEQPTLFEIVTGRNAKEKNSNNTKRKKEKEKEKESKSSSKRGQPPKKEERPKKQEKKEESEEEDGENDEEEDDHENTYCGSCAQAYNDSQFWIGCDICDNWYHGTCVKMTAAKAMTIQEYRCPSCASKKARH